MTKTQEAIQKVLETFEKGDLPKAMATAINPKLDVPCSSYSFKNRVILALNGTLDARGFKSWKEAGRQVVKGAKSIKVFTPRTKTFIDKETEEKKKVVIGWSMIPVFAVESTEGEELQYNELETPVFELEEVAEYYGVALEHSHQLPDAYGYFRPSTNTITMGTSETSVFFHELAHSLHFKSLGQEKFAKLSTEHKEIVAELTACTLSYIVNGASMPDRVGNHYNYIKNYCKGDILKECMKVFGEVEKILLMVQEAQNKKFA